MYCNLTKGGLGDQVGSGTRRAVLRTQGRKSDRKVGPETKEVTFGSPVNLAQFKDSGVKFQMKEVREHPYLICNFS